MERIVHVARGHDEARAYDIAQHRQMTPEERQRAARILKERAFGADCPDVREAERGR